jgi:hypothetical protein
LQVIDPAVSGSEMPLPPPGMSLVGGTKA